MGTLTRLKHFAVVMSQREWPLAAQLLISKLLVSSFGIVNNGVSAKFCHSITTLSMACSFRQRILILLQSRKTVSSPFILETA
jgi:hypothetical protein